MSKLDTPANTAQVIRDLLRIAKVAMPLNLYGQDPRITKATALLGALEGRPIGARPPDTGKGIPASVELADLGRRRAIDISGVGIGFFAELPWEDVIGLQRAQLDLEIPLDPSDAMSFATHDWLVSHGYLEVAQDDGRTS